jgi:hypothetical protein
MAKKKPRPYRGYKSPKECYLNKYPGVGGKELCKTDSGLYRKLLRTGKSDIMPDGRKTSDKMGRPSFSDERIAEIVNAYEFCDRKISVAAERLGCSKFTVSKYWKEAELEIRGRGEK